MFETINNSGRQAVQEALNVIAVLAMLITMLVTARSEGVLLLGIATIALGALIAGVLRQMPNRVIRCIPQNAVEYRVDEHELPRAA